MVSYHHVKYQKKLKIQSQENFVMEKEMDGRTEKQKDESDFIVHFRMTSSTQEIKTEDPCNCVKFLKFLKVEIW